MSRPSALALLFVSAFIMATTGTAAALMPPGVSGLAIGAVTQGVGGLLMLAVFARPSIAVLRDSGTRPFALIGGVAVALYGVSYYTSMQISGVAIGTVLNLGTAPLFAGLIERVLDGRRLSRRWLLGILVSIAGLVLLMTGVEREHSNPAPQAAVLGAALATLAGLLYATYTYTSKRAMGRGASASGAMGATFGTGGVLLVPLLLLNAGALFGTPRAIAVGAYLAVGPVLLAFWLFGVALKHVRTSTATSITLIEPVLASVLAVLVVGERISLLGWAGVGVVVLGLLLAAKE